MITKKSQPYPWYLDMLPKSTLFLAIMISLGMIGCSQLVPYQSSEIQVQEDPDQLFDASVRVFARKGFGIHISNPRGWVLETEWLPSSAGSSLAVHYRVMISKGKLEIFTGCKFPGNSRANCGSMRPEGTSDFERELVSSIVAEANNIAPSAVPTKAVRLNNKTDSHSDNCATGLSISADTDGHCCWPEQAWNPRSKTCVGIPKCPKGFKLDSAKQQCLPPECRAGRVRAPDGTHCCWSGQTFVHSRNSCIGIPVECPDGTKLSGENCVGAVRCPYGTAYIPGGSFQTLEGKENVSTNSFCIDKYEVTVEAYQRCVQDGVCTRPNMDIESKYCNILSNARTNHPINCVTGEQAISYCRAQGKRLPLDEEWEWAGRSAGSTRKFPWGDDSPTQQHMCWDENRGANTCVVGSFPAGASKQGVYDLSGNVYEWTIYKGKATIVRGGSWDVDEERAFRNDHRKKNPDDDWGRSVGFRCVQNALEPR